MLPIFGCLAALPAIPPGVAVGPRGAGEVLTFLVEVKEAGAGETECLELEIEVASLDVALEAGGPPECIPSLCLRALGGQLHQPEISKPQAREVGWLAQGGRRVGPPAVPGPLVTVARIARAGKGVPQGVE